MGSTRFKSKTPGIRYRKHRSRKHGKSLDRYWIIRYRHGGKENEEGLGWSSKGWGEEKAAAILHELKENQRRGTPPYTLRDKRQSELEALELAAETKRQEEASQVTFSQFWEGHYYSHCLSTKTHRTASSELGRYKLWIRPAIGTKCMGDITADDVTAIRDKVQRAGRAAQTVVHVVGIIRQVYNHAIAKGLLDGVAPTFRVALPKRDNKRARFLSKEEAKALVDELYRRSKRLGDYSLLSLYTGMRASELFSLTWGCIDFDDDVISIRDTKNGDTRHAYMIEVVREMLLRRQAESSDTSSHHLVFPSRTGNKIPQRSFSFVRAVNALKLNDGVTDQRDMVVFHTLRHTFASWLAISGTPILTLQRLMGHKTLSMTNRYAHLSPDHKRAAVNALSAFL